MSLVKHLLSDEVKVYEPKFLIHVHSDEVLITSYGAFIIIRDDLLKATFRALHTNKKPLKRCQVSITREGYCLATFELIDYENGQGKLKAI